MSLSQININQTKNQILLQQLKIRTMLFNHKNHPISQMAHTKPRAPTPIRKAPLNLQATKENLPRPNSNRNPTDFQSTKVEKQPINKPLISPVRNNVIVMDQNVLRKSQQILESEKRCPNHPNKSVQFMIQIQEEMILYCEKCAAQLASQGFEVTKIQNIKKTFQVERQKKQRQKKLQNNRKYEGQRMYEQIMAFLSQLSTIQEEHSGNMKKFEQIDNHYNKQIILTESFYDQLLRTIQHMKQDHINDLVQESKRHSQIADIEHDYLRENVDEMDTIRRDIEDNIEDIMEKLSENELEENTLFQSLNQYRQKIQVFRHKVEEQSDIFEELIHYTQEQLNQKQNLIQDYLMEVWEEKQKKVERREQQTVLNKSKEPLNHLNQQMNTQNIPSKREANNSSAFRKLFDDDEEHGIIPEPSPQFKKI